MISLLHSMKEYSGIFENHFIHMKVAVTVSVAASMIDMKCNSNGIIYLVCFKTLDSLLLLLLSEDDEWTSVFVEC